MKMILSTLVIGLMWQTSALAQTCTELEIDLRTCQALAPGIQSRYSSAQERLSQVRSRQAMIEQKERDTVSCQSSTRASQFDLDQLVRANNSHRSDLQEERRRNRQFQNELNSMGVSGWECLVYVGIRKKHDRRGMGEGRTKEEAIQAARSSCGSCDKWQHSSSVTVAACEPIFRGRR